VAGEELGVRAVFLGERSSLLAALEVEHAERRIGADRCAHHRLDATHPHALTLPKARVEEG